MPRQKSAAREQAYQLWLATDGKRPLVDIALACGASAGLVRKWKVLDGWSLDGKKKSSGNVTEPDVQIPKRNGNTKNTVTKGNGHVRKPTKAKKAPNPHGNPSLPPAPVENKYAMSTGQFETIMYESLTDAERLLAEAAIRLPPVDNALRMLAILTVREKRILDRVLQIPETETPSSEAPWPGVPASGLRWAI